jgi:hypothetical protein
MTQHNLLDFPNSFLQLILEYCDAALITECKLLSRRFNKHVLNMQFLCKYLSWNCEFSKDVVDLTLQTPEAVHLEMERLMWKQKLLSCDQAQLNQYQVEKYPVPFESANNRALGYPRITIDKEYVLIYAGLSQNQVSIQGHASAYYPAVVYETRTLRLLGYLPYQTHLSIYGHVYRKGEKCYFLTCSRAALYSTEITSNIVPNFEGSIKTSQEVKSVIAAPQGFIEDVCFDENLVALHTGKSIHLYDLDKSTLDVGQVKMYRVRTLLCSEFHVGIELAANTIEKKMGLVVSSQDSGRVEVWQYEKRPEESRMYDFKKDLWAEDEKFELPPNYGFTYHSGMLALRSNTGSLCFYKWTGEEFVPYRKFYDSCFKTFHTSHNVSYDNFYPRMMFQSGTVLTTDASGVRLSIFPFVSNIQHKRLELNHLYSSLNLADSSHQTGRIIWSYGGRRIMFLRDGGDLYVWDIAAICREDESKRID